MGVFVDHKGRGTGGRFETGGWVFCERVPRIPGFNPAFVALLPTVFVISTPNLLEGWVVDCCFVNWALPEAAAVFSFWFFIAAVARAWPTDWRDCTACI